MKFSSNYQIGHTEIFNRSYCKLLKSHYKKDSNSKKEFELLFKKIEADLQKNPYLEFISDREPFPNGCASKYAELRKVRWSQLPGLQGASGKGRLLFLIIEPSKSVYLLWIYTHQEYSTRPPDALLKQLILSLYEKDFH